MRFEELPRIFARLGPLDTLRRLGCLDLFELARIFTRLDNWETIMDALFLLSDDCAFTRHAHEHFLPAIRDYMRGKTNADYRFHPARVRRARLANATRLHFRYQRQTFERALRLLSHDCIAPEIIDSWWSKFQSWESRQLTAARR